MSRAHVLDFLTVLLLKEKTFRLKNRSKRGDLVSQPNAQKKRDKIFLTTII